MTIIIFLIIIAISVVIYYLLSQMPNNISQNDYVNLLDISLSSISISFGFFIALFTLVFGLKNNYLLSKIMGKHKLKKQFKLLNLSVITLGFIVIILSLFSLVFLFFNVISWRILKSYFICSIITLNFTFYSFLTLYLYVVVNIIFKSGDKSEMKTKKNPTLKK